jgi:hypothetical protein
MIDPAEVIGFAVDDFGVTALVNGQPLAVIPYLDAEAALQDGFIRHNGPYAVAAAGDVLPLALATGNTGDTLTIDGLDYTLLAIDPDGSGAVVLKLSEVA